MTEALARHATDIPAVGVCNVPITVKMTILGRLEKLTGESIHPQRAQLDTLGLNHLTWHRGFHLDGMDIWEQVLGAYLAELHSNPQPEWEPWLIEAMGMLPIITFTIITTPPTSWRNRHHNQPVPGW